MGLRERRPSTRRRDALRRYQLLLAVRSFDAWLVLLGTYLRCGTMATAVSLSRSEVDNVYFSGASSSSGNPLYTQAEGYYETRLSAGTSRTREITLAAPASGTVRARVRLVGGSGSSHAATVGVEARVSGGAWSTIGSTSVSWDRYDTRTLEVAGSAPGAVALRFTLTLANAATSSPAFVYLDHFEVEADRSALDSGLTSGVLDVTSAGSLARPSGAPDAFVLVAGSQQGGRVRMGSAIAAAQGDLFFSPTTALVSPSRMTAHRRALLDDVSREVDYLVVTTPALRASAQAHADFHQQRGLRTLIVEQQDIFDQFDGGRQRPIAVRRLLHAMQQWTASPRFVLFWGDALLPSRNKKLAPWEVVSFGNSVSDAWFGMQYGGPNDWSEVAAIGRIPVRSNAEGQAFTAKLVRYENGRAGRVATAGPVRLWRTRIAERG